MSTASKHISFQTVCPCCDTHFTVAGTLAGKTGDCPKCSARITAMPGKSVVNMVETKKSPQWAVRLVLIAILLLAFFNLSLFGFLVALLICILIDNASVK